MENKPYPPLSKKGQKNLSKLVDIINKNGIESENIEAYVKCPICHKWIDSKDFHTHCTSLKTV